MRFLGATHAGPDLADLVDIVVGTRFQTVARDAQIANLRTRS